jgi:nucleoside-diphosphate kinase
MCIIKPHAVAEKRSGAIIDSLLKADFEISAARSLVLATKDVGDYLEAYRSVYPEYEKWIAELSSGPAIVLEVRGDSVVDNLREFVGPYDPEIAKILRPSSTRAVHGLNAVRNAVHVTDLANDGPLESKFFFYVLE